MILDLANTWKPWRDEISQSLIDGASDALDRAKFDGLWAKVVVDVDSEETKSWFRELMQEFSGVWSGATLIARLEENVTVNLKEPGVEGLDLVIDELELSRIPV